MSTVKFGQVSEGNSPDPKTDKTTDAEVIETPKEETAVSPPAKPTGDTSLAKPASHDDDGVYGDVDDGDVQFPRLRLIQGTSKFANKAPVGTITLGFDGELLIVADEGVKVPFMVASVRKQFQEKVPWGTDKMPQTFDTREQVLAAGGQIENPRGAAYYDSIAHVQMFVGVKTERAEKDKQADLIEGFSMFEFDGHLWCPAIYTASGMSYSSFAKSIFTAHKFRLKELHRGLFSMHGSEVPTNFGPKKKLNASLVRELEEDELKTLAKAQG